MTYTLTTGMTVHLCGESCILAGGYTVQYDTWVFIFIFLIDEL